MCFSHMCTTTHIWGALCSMFHWAESHDFFIILLCMVSCQPVPSAVKKNTLFHLSRKRKIFLYGMTLTGIHNPVHGDWKAHSFSILLLFKGISGAARSSPFAVSSLYARAHALLDILSFFTHLCGAVKNPSSRKVVCYGTFYGFPI